MEKSRKRRNKKKNQKLKKKSQSNNNRKSKRRKGQSQRSILIKIMTNFLELPEVNIRKFTSWRQKDKKTMHGAF